MGASVHLLAGAYASLLGATDPVAARERIADAFAGLIAHDELALYAVVDRDGTLERAVQRGPSTPGQPATCHSQPLLAHGELLGVVDIVRADPGNGFTDVELELAQALADGAAMALENAIARQRLELLALTDPLTGLFNHRYFYDRLEGELARARRAGQPLSLVVVDIDDFKRVNDIHGHAVGDSVIVEVGRLLRTAVRLSDAVCRLGGEEFGVIMPVCDGDGALVFTARLTELLRSTSFDEAGTITVSAGIATGPGHAASPRGLFACADAAMRTAKARGKDRAVVWETDGVAELPGETTREVRSLAHMKTLQSLTARINRLRSVDEICAAIVDEIGPLLGSRDCRVHVLEEGTLRIAAATAAGATAAPVGDELVAGAVATRRSRLQRRDGGGDAGTAESVAVVPLAYGVDALGAIEIVTAGDAALDADDVRLLEVLAGQASVALVNARLYDDLRREADHARALVRFGDLVADGTVLADVLERVAAGAAAALNAQRASVWLPIADGDLAPRLGAAAGPGEGVHDALYAPGELAATGRVVAQALPVLDPLAPLPVSVCPVTGGPAVTLALAPLLLRSGHVGALAVAVAHEGLSPAELRLLSGIAGTARLALAKAAELDELRTAHRLTSEALVRAHAQLPRVA